MSIFCGGIKRYCLGIIILFSWYCDLLHGYIDTRPSYVMSTSNCDPIWSNSCALSATCPAFIFLHHFHICFHRPHFRSTRTCRILLFFSQFIFRLKKFINELGCRLIRLDPDIPNSLEFLFN